MGILGYVRVIGLSLLTTVIFIALILYSDRKSREPAYMIFLSLVSCIFTICLSLILGQVLLPKLEIISSGLFDYGTTNIIKIIMLALVEEYSKLVVLYLFISKNSNFDDVYDGFVYSSLIALSFAALESLIYVFSEPNIDNMTSLAILRGITTVPLHLICGISMGYFMGKEKFTWGTKARARNLALCLLFPTFLHFIYNFTLANIIRRYLNSPLLTIVIVLFFLPFYIIGVIFIDKTKVLNKKFKNNEHYKNLMTNEEYNEIVNKRY